MAQVIWTPEAEKTLKEIHEYVCLADPAAAYNLVDAIRDRADQISAFPMSGYRLHDYPQHVRVILHGRYRIVYRILDDNPEKCYVLGIFHGSMEIERHLRIDGGL